MTFTDFSKMMDELGGISSEEGKRLVKLHLSEEEAAKFEDDGMYLFLSSSFSAEPLLHDFINKSGLNVITQTWESDDKDQSVSYYSTGEQRVNRERWFFCRSNKQAQCKD